MARQAPFTQHEAVLLLDAFLQTLYGGISRKEAISNCSSALRQMAKANGITVDDVYRNVNGITFQMASMESAYYGRTIMKPATRLFADAVKMYKDDYKEYDKVLGEVKAMTGTKADNEDAFMGWLSKKVSSAQLSELYMTFQEIEEQARKSGLIKDSLYESINISLFRKIKTSIDQSRLFKFKNKRQMGKIYSSLNYLVQYAREQEENNAGRTELQSSLSQESSVFYEKKQGNELAIRKESRRNTEGHNNREEFYQWMINDQHMAEATCRSYVSAIRGAEKHAEEHSLESISLFGVTAEEARKTADALFGDAEFIVKNEVQHNRFRAAITKLLAYLGEDWTVPDGSFSAKRMTASPEKVTVQVDVKPYETVLIQKFPRGYRLGSSIEMRKFRRYFEEINENALEQEADEIEKIIGFCGIEHEGRVYAPKAMLSEDLRNKLFDFIDKDFEEGKTVVYYEALFKEFSEDFLDQNIYDAEMLKAYIAYMARGRYFMARSYLSNERRSSVDPIEDVRTCLKEHGLPMEVDDLCKTLSHIPSDRIRMLLSTHGEFVRNSKGEYFHADSFSVTEEELDNISDLIGTEIKRHSFISGNELYDVIKGKYPYIYERNAMFSVIGWRDALKYKLGNRFSFTGNIISSKDKELSMSDVFAAYGEDQEGFTLSELLAFAENMGSTIYFDALYKNAARVSREQFVSRDDVSFRVKETDKALSRFCIGSYLALPGITDFGIFPEASHPWTPYLLEHYVAFHSKHYYLMHGGYNRNTVVGAMVKRENVYDSFDDLIVDVIAESGVPLQKKDVLNYLSDNGYIARRTYTGIEALMIKARAKRNKKEK